MKARGKAAFPDSAAPFTEGGLQGGPVYGKSNGIWWRSSGTGSPLVLVQGLGYPAAMFHRLVPLLEPHFRVIVFDHRGIGNSSRANGLDSLTIGRMASDVEAVIMDAAGGQADLMGVSLGGIIAQEVALAYPRSIRKLILACTHTADSKVVLADAKVLEMMSKRASMEDEEALRSSVPYVYAPTTPVELIEEDLAVRREMHRGWEGYTAQLRAAGQYGGTSARLPRVQAETLVIHGALDQLVPPGNASVIGERIPGAELIILPGVSHNFYSEAPKESAAAIIRFLQAPMKGQDAQSEQAAAQKTPARAVKQGRTPAKKSVDAPVQRARKASAEPRTGGRRKSVSQK